MNLTSRGSCWLLSGALVALLPAMALAQPTFTGDVEADFVDEQTLVPSDDLDDVGLPAAAPMGTVSGWDIKDVRFFYDRVNDELFVGLNFVGVGGDPDGDGDPTTTAPWLASQGGLDFPSWTGTESFVVSFDFNMDGDFDVVAGLDLFSDITQFQVATADITAPTPPLSFDTPLPGNIGIVPNDTSGASPDIEFSIVNASTLPGATWTPGADPASVMFFASAFAGGLADDGVGEDNLLRHLLVAGKVSWDRDSDGALLVEDSNVETGMNFANQGILVLGISDTGNPGAYVNDYSDDPTTLDLNPNGGDFLADPYVLQTKSGANMDDSDAGLLTIQFVSPITGDPVSAHYASVRVVDMEDAADRGNGYVDFNTDMGVNTVNLVNGADGNLQDVSQGAPAGDINIDSFDVKTGDTDDSAAIDLVCWTYWEEIPTLFQFDGNVVPAENPVIYVGTPGNPAVTDLSREFVAPQDPGYTGRRTRIFAQGGIRPDRTNKTVGDILHQVQAPRYSEHLLSLTRVRPGITLVFIALCQVQFNYLTGELLCIERRVTPFALEFVSP